MRDHRPAAALPAAPSAQPMTKPMTTGKMCKTRLFAVATSAASPPTRTALRPSINRVTFVVITAVVGVFFERDLRECVLYRHRRYTAHAGDDRENASGSLHGPAVTLSKRKAISASSCKSRSG